MYIWDDRLLSFVWYNCTPNNYGVYIIYTHYSCLTNKYWNLLLHKVSCFLKILSCIMTLYQVIRICLIFQLFTAIPSNSSLYRLSACRRLESTRGEGHQSISECSGIQTSNIPLDKEWQEDTWQWPLSWINNSLSACDSSSHRSEWQLLLCSEQQRRRNYVEQHCSHIRWVAILYWECDTITFVWCPVEDPGHSI